MLEFLFTAAVNGQIILESIWDMKECSGQPTAMTLFPAQNASSLWLTWQDNYLYPYCGCDYIPLHTGCCISSIDLAQSDGIKSAMYVVDDNAIPVADYWSEANENYFCKYTADDASELDWGYLVRYVKPDGSCFDGIICRENSLEIYANKNCSGLSESFSLSSNPQVFASVIFNKPINALYVNFIGGQSITKWTTYFPMAILVPKFQVPMEIVGLVSYILAVGIAIYASMIELQRLMRNAKGSLFLFIAQIMWLVWVSLNIMDWTIEYPTVLAYEVTEAILSALYSISTLLATLTTFSLIMDYYEYRHRQRSIRFAILISIHIVLAGAGYLYFISYFDLTAWMFTYWYYLFPGWNLVFFLLNTIPPILILAQIGHLYGYVNKINSNLQIYMTLMTKSPAMAVLMPFQILNTVAYMVLISVLQFTELLQNDRNFIACNGLVSLSLIIHEVLNYWIKNFVHQLMLKIDKENSKDIYVSKIYDTTIE
ncbi:hypothetical protein HDV06_003049 [Boothiomyces sp. JEL0866]|nr:hypothetical protein HDV06_003049 [Boothiomyces sp. JEL0866]